MIRRRDIQPIVQGDKKVIRGWVMYDWSNSVFQLTITTAIFPLYYTAITSNGNGHIVTFFGAEVINTVLYSWAIASAFLLVGLLSPLLSSMADYSGRRKTFMKVFTWIGAVSCSTLFFFDKEHLELGVIAFSLGTFGYAGSIVFYNSFLPVIAKPEHHDRISAQGYAMGYLGGVVLLLLQLAVIQKPGWFGIPAGSDLQFRIAFLTVGLWWIGFSQITFSRLPKYIYKKRSGRESVLFNGYKELRLVYRQIRKSNALSLYLVCYFFFMMGLLSVMYMAASFGKKEVGLEDSIMIPTLLLIQLVGMGGAWMFARLSGKIGNFRALMVALVTWTLICTGAYYITDAAGFIVAAFFIGIVMGGTQALARSTYSKMLPETTDHTSFFSFYDVMEKLASAGGTFCFGLIEAITGNMRASVVAIGIFFLFGLIFIILVMKIHKSRHIIPA
ncbi:MAG: MFS transporter [Bacteroidales bacterium]|jgi:UMF1 family MFS transporter|nr:MFS transporter [Bacteroidales bacterium]